MRSVTEIKLTTRLNCVVLYVVFGSNTVSTVIAKSYTGSRRFTLGNKIYKLNWLSLNQIEKEK